MEKRLSGHLVKHILVIAIIAVFFLALLPFDEVQYTIHYYEQKFPDYSKIVSAQENGEEQLLLYIPNATTTPNKPIQKKIKVRAGRYIPELPQNLSLALNEISYEIRGPDYALINGLDFMVLSNVSSIRVNVLVYLWDENDPVNVRAFQRQRIPYMAKNYRTARLNESATIPVHIPFNDINLTKTIKMTVADYVPEGARAFGTFEYSFKINSSE